MTLIIKQSFKKKVNTLYEQYVNSFLSEWTQEGRYEPCVLIGDEEKGDGVWNESFTDEQIEFIRLYLGHLMIDGDTEENLKDIEYFLSMQGAINTNNRMEIRFMLGNPAEVFVYVDDFSDVDLADAYGITGFKSMHIYNANMKKWTLKAVKELIRDVKDDFKFDGFEPKLDYRYAGPLLEIKCRIEN